MKVAEQMGLIGAGSVAQSFLARLPSLHARLGPIKGVSYPAARRLTVALRAGFAVPNYSALEFCPVIWIYVPDQSLDAVLRDLTSQTPMRRTMIVVCNTIRESPSFELLRSRGARVATLNQLDGKGGFVGEGNRETLREIRSILNRDRRRLLQLRTGGKAAYLAGRQMMEQLLRPFVTSAIACFRSAGLTRPEAVEMVEAIASRSLRSYGRAGAKPWSRPELRALHGAMDTRVRDLQKTSPLDAALYAHGLHLALEYFDRDNLTERAATHHA